MLKINSERNVVMSKPNTAVAGEDEVLLDSRREEREFGSKYTVFQKNNSLWTLPLLAYNEGWDRDRPDKPDRPDGHDKPDRPDGHDKPDRPDGHDKPDRPDGRNKPDKPDNGGIGGWHADGVTIGIGLSGCSGEVHFIKDK